MTGRRQVRKNLARSPASADVWAANERALANEAEQRAAPWRATDVGIVGDGDRQHLLVAGLRQRDAVVGAGLALFDPVGDEAVLVTPQDDGVLVEIGPLHLADAPGLSAEVRGCVELVSRAYDLDVDLLSRWAVARVLEAASTAFRRQGIETPSLRALVARDPVAVWRMLGDRMIMQPWGIGVDSRLGAWA